MSLSRTSTQHVLIFGEAVFEEGLAHMLKIGTNLRVSDARYKDENALLDHIARKRPDAIVLNESTPLNTARILKLLFSIPSIDGLRIIIMRLANNRIDKYEMPKKIFRTGYAKFSNLRLRGGMNCLQLYKDKGRGLSLEGIL